MAIINVNVTIGDCISRLRALHKLCMNIPIDPQWFQVFANISANFPYYKISRKFTTLLICISRTLTIISTCYQATCDQLQICHKYRVSSCCPIHGTTAAFRARLPGSPSVFFCSRAFRTQPMVRACMSVHWRSVRPSWTTVTAIRRWMPWCSRNVPQHGRSSECDTLVDT